MGQSRYRGMTVNESLVTAGLLEQWDGAVHAADRAQMIAILQQIDLGDGAGAIADRVLANPNAYGF